MSTQWIILTHVSLILDNYILFQLRKREQSQHTCTIATSPKYREEVVALAEVFVHNHMLDSPHVVGDFVSCGEAEPLCQSLVGIKKIACDSMDTYFREGIDGTNPQMTQIFIYAKQQTESMRMRKDTIEKKIVATLDVLQQMQTCSIASQMRCSFYDWTLIYTGLKWVVK